MFIININSIYFNDNIDCYYLPFFITTTTNNIIITINITIVYIMIKFIVNIITTRKIKVFLN